MFSFSKIITIGEKQEKFILAVICVIGNVSASGRGDVGLKSGPPCITLETLKMVPTAALSGA